MSGTILIVEDEPALADAYAQWFQNDFKVMVAYDGESVIEHLAPEIDVILLDRRLPGRSGDSVLEIINRCYPDCRVAMISAVDPDFDIINMDFDDYLVKPVKKDKLRTTVDRLFDLSDYDDQTQLLYQHFSKQKALKEAKSRAELDRSKEYQDFKRRLEQLKTQVRSTEDDTVETPPELEVLPWER